MRRLAQVARGVQDVRGQHHVELPVRKPRVAGIALDVEGGVAHEVRVAELIACQGGEEARHIGEDVLTAVGRQPGQDIRRGATGAGADLEDPDQPAARQSLHGPGDRLGGRGVREAGEGRLLVHLLEPRDRSLGKEDLERVGSAPEHAGKRLTAGRREAQLGLARGLPRDQRGNARAVIHRLQGADDREARLHPPEPAVLGEDIEHPAQQPEVARQHAQFPGHSFHRDDRGRQRVPSQRHQRIADHPGRNRVELSAQAGRQGAGELGLKCGSGGSGQLGKLPGRREAAGGGRRRGRMRRLDPVALPLERVRGQGHAPPLAGRVERLPVDREPPDLERAERAEQCRPLVASGPERRQPDDRLVRHAELAQAAERGGRAELDEQVEPVLAEPPYTLLKPDRLPGVPAPVRRSGGVRAKRRGGQVRDERDARRRRCDRCGEPLEGFQRRLDLRRMVGAGDRENLGGESLVLELRTGAANGRGRPGDHGVHRAVDRGHAGSRTPRPESFGHQVAGCEHGGHGALGTGFFHQAAPLGDEPQPILCREHAGKRGGGKLAEAVSQHGGWLDAPAPPQLGQRELDREECRLNQRCPLQPRGVRVQQPGHERMAGERAKGGVEPLEAGPEAGARLAEPAGHSRVL